MSPKRSTLLLGALALAFAAAAQDRGKLLGIKAGGDARASTVLIFADRPLSFTTMKLADPPRVVVDFADTGIASARRELTVEDGTVRRVAMAAAGSRTARVVVELEADAEFDVRTVRNEVELRIARPTALASAERSGTAAPQQPPAAQPPEQPAPAGPAEQTAAAQPPEQPAAKPPEQ
ncbi:MAG TPA: AMIN domain-containing protein, partial [Myxococcales bacterium]